MEGFPQVTPYLLYEDVPAALDWLTRAFGEGVIMLGDPGESAHQSGEHGPISDRCWRDHGVLPLERVQSFFDRTRYPRFLGGVAERIETWLSVRRSAKRAPLGTANQPRYAGAAP